MEEFRRLPWPVSDYGTDMQQTYALNMPDFLQRNPTDTFFCNLMDIDPLHLQYDSQNRNQSADTEQFVLRQFTDPRTGIEIPSHECTYKNIDLKTRNLFLTNYIQVSNLKKHEHSACLNALGCSSKPESELTIEEKKDRLIFDSTSVSRLEEKNMYLEKLREHYFANISKRFHDVPPSIEYFVTQNWKKQLVTMHRHFSNVNFSLKTAICLQLSEFTVTINAIHQEHLGNVPEMCTVSLDYLRQSFPNLMKAYNKRKNKHLLPEIRENVKDLVEQNGIDFVIPISILKRIIQNSKTGWSFCMTVKESAISTVFNPKKEIVCEKPLPPTYLSGNDRYRRGAKYLLHSCFNGNALHIFNHTEKVENSTPIQVNAEDVECDINSNAEMEYKIINCDEFIKNHPTNEASYENMTLTIFDVKGYNSAEDTNETFKILVPTKQATYKKDTNGAIKFCNWSPKIEYQAEYGAEVMTRDELILEWCELYFRSNTSTERVHFDCMTGKVIHHQSITLVDVENELRTKYDIDTQQLLQRLWHALQTFEDFPPGEYLLQSDSNSIKIYEKTKNSTESVNISQILKSVTLEKNLLDNNKADWRPIDENIVTEIHKRYQILPCAFPHSHYLSNNNVKLFRGEQLEQNRGPRRKEMLKICPIDDSHDIINREQSRKRKMEQRSELRKQQRKNIKKKRNRAKRTAKNAAKKANVEEHESAKKLLYATMDQYNVALGESLTESMSTGSSPIATRPVSRSKCAKEQNPTKQFIRRSSRVTPKKAN